MEYPALLTPNGSAQHGEFRFPVVTVSLKKWAGETLGNTFGGKGVVDHEGEPMFAELAIQRLAVASGWNARWVETYGAKAAMPYFFEEWAPASISAQTNSPVKTPVQEELIRNIMTINGGHSGFWDALAWHGNETVFYEAKLRKHDRLNKNQYKWVRSALEAGLSIDQFVLFDWQYAV
ncbi:hypothetical protein [Subtercola lobariae]|nr:hypothetical protein [Subtercola lobariae]